MVGGSGGGNEKELSIESYDEERLRDIKDGSDCPIPDSDVQEENIGRGMGGGERRDDGPVSPFVLIAELESVVSSIVVGGMAGKVWYGTEVKRGRLEVELLSGARF